ncbi:type I restriction-modification system subunit M [Alienimonas sp. DA493]|uniref:class I SAM-dependent DNA methyltransferase n=1 Tax=Alienimonas sp. DA493 TaxID=3373605 RepID=UPI003753EE85
MSDESSREFLRNLDAKLWAAADKLRNNLDAAQYKHAVLGLIFLKYVSDSFAARRAEVERLLRDEDSDYYLPRDDFDSDEEYAEAIHQELEDRDYYTAANVFWVPPLARWGNLQDWVKLPANTEVEVRNGKTETYTIKSPALLIDHALEAVEKENGDRLKNVLNRNYAQLHLDPDNLRGLVDLVASIPFEHADLHAKDILGHVYEYFLGQFALAEGKKGGQYFTPQSIVGLIVAMLEPYRGRVYDPAMGSGGFFVQSEKFVESHGGTTSDISVYGQESNPTTWRLAAMNLAIRGIEFDFGKRWANSFTSDLHPDLRADFVMANPPFNISDWWDEKLADDPRWQYGTPPKGNANFAWMQHMLYHLAPHGSMALLLANGSMSGTSGGEGDIRKRLVEEDLVECLVALPGQLFTNTQIPACVWFLTKDKTAREGRRDRTGEVLFIDARDVGYMADRVLRAFTEEDRDSIAGAFHRWRRGDDYEDEPGFCKSATLAEIAAHGHVLTPGRYVGAAAAEDDGEPFEEKMARLTKELREQFAESATLEATIREKLNGVGYEV